MSRFEFQGEPVADFGEIELGGVSRVCALVIDQGVEEMQMRMLRIEFQAAVKLAEGVLGAAFGQRRQTCCQMMIRAPLPRRRGNFIARFLGQAGPRNNNGLGHHIAAGQKKRTQAEDERPAGSVLRAICHRSAHRFRMLHEAPPCEDGTGIAPIPG